MSNYTKSTNFATKDNLTPGDPLKIVRGTEIDTEFNNIATAIATKTDNSAAAITGGSITGITDLAIADGGTGASTATAAINNLLPSQTSNANKYLQTDGTNVSWDAVSLSTSDITGTLPVANGGTGVTSSTGTGSVVLSNNPTLVTPALGTPASGTLTNATGLPISTGVSGLGTGVATFLATPSSANLASAVSDETGSGALVFANSPTLVTPALGTPSSATLTNATGLPISTGVSGLGTGVATALAVNVGSAGAPIVNGGALGTPSSGTVTNLTGTASININGTVGATTPTTGSFTTLTTSSTVTLNGGVVNGVTYLNASKVLTSGSALTFDGSFYLGLTGAMKINSAGYKLRFYDATGATGYGYFYTDGTNLQFDSGNTQPLSFLINGTEGMRLTSTGLGIGTSSPSNKLVVSNAGANGLEFNPTNGQIVTYNRSTSAYSALTLLGLSFTVQTGASPADRLTVNASGNVGIGTTSPSAKLDVNSGATTTAAWMASTATTAYSPTTSASVSNARLQLFGGNATGAYTAIRFSQTGSFEALFGAVQNSAGTADFIWQGYNGSAYAERMRLDSAGLLQVGTTSPAGASQITAYGASNGQIAVQNSTNWSRLLQNAGDLYIDNGVGGSAGNIIFRQGSSTTERARIDTSGNLGLGVTPSAWESSYRAFQYGAGSAFLTGRVGALQNRQMFLGIGASHNGTNWIYTPTGVAVSHYAQTDGAHAWYTAPSGTAGNAISFTQAMTLDASGNLGLGTTSLSSATGYIQQTINGTNGSYLNLRTNGTTVLQVGCDGGNAYINGPASAGSVIFQNAGSERARIDSSGHFLVGTTSNSATSGVGIKSVYDTSFPYISTVGTATTNSNVAYTLYSTGAAAYRFYVGYAGTVYATSTTITAISDQRLKENIRDLDEGLATVMALKPRKFDWKEGKGQNIKNARGFIAQEFETVLPDMIEEWRDPAPEGEEAYKAINANLIPTLVKAIQELKAEFDAYKASHP